MNPCEIEELVIQGIRDRRDAGRKEHGATMERQDLSLADWLEHLEEELTDAAVYVRKLRVIVDKMQQGIDAGRDLLDVVMLSDTSLLVDKGQWSLDEQEECERRLVAAQEVLNGKPLDVGEAPR